MRLRYFFIMDVEESIFLYKFLVDNKYESYEKF